MREPACRPLGPCRILPSVRIRRRHPRCRRHPGRPAAEQWTYRLSRKPPRRHRHRRRCPQLLRIRFHRRRCPRPRTVRQMNCRQHRCRRRHPRHRCLRRNRRRCRSRIPSFRRSFPLRHLRTGPRPVLQRNRLCRLPRHLRFPSCPGFLQNHLRRCRNRMSVRYRRRSRRHRRRLDRLRHRVRRPRLSRLRIRGSFRPRHRRHPRLRNLLHWTGRRPATAGSAATAGPDRPDRPDRLDPAIRPRPSGWFRVRSGVPRRDRVRPSWSRPWKACRRLREAMSRDHRRAG